MTTYNGFVLGKATVCVVCHTWVHREPLSEYLQNKVAKLILIRHPFSMSKRIMNDLSSTAEFYIAGNVDRIMRFPFVNRAPEITYWLKDILATIYFAFRSRGKIDLYVGVDNLNCLVGIFLRRLGKVRNVIYYSLDFHPKRFKSGFFNRLYYGADRFCCYRSDVNWFVSAAMHDERISQGWQDNRFAPVVTVPWGTFFNRIDRKPYEEIKRRELIFMGSLIASKGPGLCLEALPDIRRRAPGTTLKFVGIGQEEEVLGSRAAELDILDEVTFTGHIEEDTELEEILTRGAIGLAPYVPDPENYTMFADPGKVRVYLGCGLPVILTDVPAMARDVEQNKAGFVIPYEMQALVDSAVKLLVDDSLFREYRDNASRMGAETSWEAVFGKALGLSQGYFDQAVVKSL